MPIKKTRVLMSLKTSLVFMVSVTTAVIANAADEVRLMHAQFTPYYENGYSENEIDYAEFEGAVEVKNLGPNKKVWLHYKNSEGVWLDHPAFYVAPTTHGYEAFSFRLPLLGSVSDIELALKYEVNGQTYWDNNGQNNYVFDGTNHANSIDPSTCCDG